MYSPHEDKRNVEAWQALVHVCRRWRSLVLASPRRLNLRLFCTPKTSARDTLDVWPALPLIVAGFMALTPSTDNIIALLGQRHRVCQVSVDLTNWQLAEILGPMQVPFPELTKLKLHSTGTPAIPDSFLGGSAPRLRIVDLRNISFPGLPNLLLSATYLVELCLTNIPHYISPETIVALLSVLSSLESLHLNFKLGSLPDWGTRRPPPSKRSIIPALTSLVFHGVIEYLEDIVTGIETPRFEDMDISLDNDYINLDTSPLAQFINRTPKFTKPNAHVEFFNHCVCFVLRPGLRTLDITLPCVGPDYQLSSIKQVCNSSLRPLSTVASLYIDIRHSRLAWTDDAVDDTLWLQLLFPFTAVKNLYLSKEISPGLAAALQELVGGRITEVLPNLQNIFVEGLELSGPFQENIGHFVAARQLSGHPVTISDCTISDWDRDSDIESM